MPRKKTKDQDKVLRHPIIVRVTATTYKKLSELCKESDHKTIGHLIRCILENKPIKLLHIDNSLNPVMEELALIRKEIKSIGVNINQQTHRFHLSQNDTERSFHALKTGEIYKTMEPKIDRLLSLITRLAEKWLQK